MLLLLPCLESITIFTRFVERRTGSHFLENQRMSGGNSVLTGMSGNCRGISCCLAACW